MSLKILIENEKALRDFERENFGSNIIHKNCLKKQKKKWHLHFDELEEIFIYNIIKQPYIDFYRIFLLRYLDALEEEVESLNRKNKIEYNIKFYEEETWENQNRDDEFVEESKRLMSLYMKILKMRCKLMHYEKIEGNE